MRLCELMGPIYGDVLDKNPPTQHGIDRLCNRRGARVFYSGIPTAEEHIEEQMEGMGQRISCLIDKFGQDTDVRTLIGLGIDMSFLPLKVFEAALDDKEDA